jgi:hypothetical protein
MDIKFNEFNPEEFFHRDKPFCSIISAARNSGKSNLLKHLYLDYFCPKNMFDVVILFSQTLCNDFYASFLNTKLIYTKYKPEALKELIQKAKHYESHGKKLRCLVILDDCISTRDKYDSTITSVFTQGRHYNTSLIYITQKLGFCATTWFNNCNLLVFLRSPSRVEKKYIADRVLVDPLSCKLPTSCSQTKLMNISVNIITRETNNYRALIVTPLTKVDPTVSDEERYKHLIFTYKAPNMDNSN